jgi:hypothetical protein
MTSLKEKLRELFSEDKWIAEQFMYQDVGYLLDKDSFQRYCELKVTHTYVDHYGGEGQGDDYWSVVKFTDNSSGEEVLVRFNGWYLSYSGAEYTDFDFVTPKQKMVTFYE